MNIFLFIVFIYVFLKKNGDLWGSIIYDFFLYVLKMIDFRVFNDKLDVKDLEVFGVKLLKVG